MKEKSLQVQGREVATRVKRLEKDRFTYEVEAEVGATIVAGRMTVGLDKGVGVEKYTQEMLQRDLDIFRQKLAEEAVWRAGIAEMMEKVK